MMKKVIVMALAVLLFCAGLVACTPQKNVLTVGICNYVDDASLNQIVANLESELEKIAAEKNVEIRIVSKNCLGDAATMNQIIAGFISKKADVMVGVATPVAMAMQAATEDNGIPVVFAAVSDPVGSELVDSLDKPGGNVTGTSDYLDTTAVFNLITALKPEIAKVGLLYDVGQDSSKTSIEAARKYLNDRGIEIVEKTGSTATEISQATAKLISSGVEAVFTPTDNSIMTAELSIYESLRDAAIPHFCGADSFALNGAFLGYGVDYANLGRETAKMVGEILFDQKSPAEMPVMTFDNGTATVNTQIASALGYDMETLETLFAPYCTRVRTIVTAESFDNLLDEN